LPLKDGPNDTSGVAASTVGCAGSAAPLIDTIRSLGTIGGKMTMG
jgi:hypothetical protein